VKIAVVTVTVYMESEEASSLLCLHCNLLCVDSPLFKLKFYYVCKCVTLVCTTNSLESITLTTVKAS
jgi:hypothetical protein